MSKTPEELAHYYADRLHERTAHSGVFVEGFVAGYQAAKDQLIRELESVVKRKRYLKDEHWFSFEEIKDYLG